MEQLRMYKQPLSKMDPIESSSSGEESLAKSIVQTKSNDSIDQTLENNNLILIVLFGIFFAGMISANAYLCKKPLIICNLTNVTLSQNITNDKTNVIPVINWWHLYIKNCCLTEFDENKFLDCSANATCSYFLINWLKPQNLTLTQVAKKCCYEYRSFNQKNYGRYCSFQCLNTHM